MYIHVYIYTYTYIHIWAPHSKKIRIKHDEFCVYICIYKYVHIYIYTYICTHKCIHIPTCIHMYNCTYKYLSPQGASSTTVQNSSCFYCGKRAKKGGKNLRSGSPTSIFCHTRFRTPFYGLRYAECVKKEKKTDVCFIDPLSWAEARTI